MAEEAPAEAVEGYGVVVTHAAGEAEPVALVGVIDVTPPSSDTADVDTSHMLSPGRVKESKPGWITPGEMTIKLHQNPEQTAGFRDLQAARTVETWTITWVDGSVASGPGYIKRVGLPTEREGLVTVDLVVKISGLWDFEGPEEGP